jgi:hypothetical protein
MSAVRKQSNPRHPRAFASDSAGSSPTGGRPERPRGGLAFALLATLCLFAAASAHAQTVASVESSQQLFAVMCALHAAGYESDVDAAKLSPLRAQLRVELQAKSGPATQALRAFYHEHERADSAATLSRYVSYALVVGPPPKFDFLMIRDDLPPDVLALEGFTEVLADFYREAEIERFWARVQPVYDREVRRVEGTVAQTVFVTSGYLRELLRPRTGRGFTVYVEPMAGRRSNFRSYGGRYSIVLDPSQEISQDEIRHSFLHFLLDDLPRLHRPSLAGRKAVLDAAARAPRLSLEFREDFIALFTECLIKAVELRIQHPPAARAQAALDETEANGFVLTRALYAALDGYEKSEPSMRGYFPELLKGLNFEAEGKRLEKIQFAAVPESQANDATLHPVVAPEPSELERWLAEGQRQLAAQDKEAIATFERILAKYPGEPRAQYGLAVASVIRGDSERATNLLRQVIATLSPAGEPAGDPRTLAWAHIWLGRIFDVEERRDLAVPEYRRALGVPGVPESARVAAQKGLDKP